MEQSISRTEGTGTVEKALDVLFHLHGAGGAQGVTAIGRALGLPKSTAHRLVSSLATRGLVERDDRGRYRPGMALVALGLGVLEHEPVVEAAGPVMERCAREVGETIFLVSARAGRLIVLDKCEGSGFLRASPRVGSEIPAHATAIGKIYLALAPELLEVSELDVYTERTIDNRSRLEPVLERVAAQGYAENYDEWTPGLAAVAAPVALRGRLCAAVAIAGPLQHFGAERRNVLITRVREAGERIGARLEGRAA
jgi:DNA-binding IclR family transcriptional regulator